MSLISRFICAQDGSMPIMFAVAAFPLIGVTGVAVDYARAVQARTTLQSAADSTVLALARQAHKKTEAELRAMAGPYFAQVTPNAADFAFGVPSITKGKKNITLEARGVLQTNIAGIFGFPTWEIGVRAASAYGTKKIEVALVLDNTGSMSASNKIVELKKASKALVSILKGASVEPGQVKISIVPYTTRINLGAGYKDETWLTNVPTGSFMGGYAIPKKRDAWGGCVADRDSPYNRSSQPVSIAMSASLYPMVNCVDGLAQAQPLTDNWAALNTRIDSMKASGMTNITLGAQWGFEMLSGAAPFSETSGTSDTERFMILLTDGENTQDRWGAWDTTRMDKDTKAMCDQIVERGVPEGSKIHRIRLYTVLVISGNESLLKSCASSPKDYFKVNAANELESVFRKIADEIGQVRLTM